MAIDVARARADTPGCERVLHFNNAGAALMPNQVVEATIAHLRLEAETGGYEAADTASERLEATYDSIATLINCARGEIAVVENATRAWDMAFYSIPLRSGDRIVTAMAEYASNFIAYLQLAQRLGVEIVPIPNDSSGQLDVQALADHIDDRTRLIAVTHVPTNGGLVNPASAIGRVARETGVLYLLDACQSVGQMPIDVAEIGCDMLSATGRKFLRGPRGTGFLYVRGSVCEQLEPAFLDLHAATWTGTNEFQVRPDARRFETWETNVAGKLGLGRAIEYALDWGLEPVWRRIQTLGAALRSGLGDLRGITITDQGSVRCGIVTFTVASVSSLELQHRLAQRGINVSVSPREYTRLDMDARDLPDVVRASVHYYNTEDEVQRFIEAVDTLAR